MIRIWSIFPQTVSQNSDIQKLNTYNFWQKLMTHEKLFINARLYAPSPNEMLIPEMRKHAMLLAYSSGNSLTPMI